MFPIFCLFTYCIRLCRPKYFPLYYMYNMTLKVKWRQNGALPKGFFLVRCNDKLRSHLTNKNGAPPKVTCPYNIAM